MVTTTRTLGVKGARLLTGLSEAGKKVFTVKEARKTVG